MSKRSLTILLATGSLLALLVVLLLVPAPAENVEAINAITARIEGALGILFPAVLHTLAADKEKSK